MKSRIIISENYDPAYNLALEEYLIEKEESILYLWQNDKTIVIGRNQNPYKECNIDKIKKDKINLVRRRSGGGAVYHDLGNLNFTIISKKNNNNIEENFDFVNKALNSIGIESVFNGRNDLHVLDKKISGNAFFEENNIFCHHGTLLVDVDMNKLSQYLTASKLKLDSKGIKSIKSRVLNLKDLNENITIDLINDAFVKQYKLIHDIDCVEYIYKEDIKRNKELMEKVKRYKS
ncbi:MAG TPA: lipoate--protein ligase family protein, partial [Tissierellaceae bacterium]